MEVEVEVNEEEVVVVVEEEEVEGVKEVGRWLSGRRRPKEAGRVRFWRRAVNSRLCEAAARVAVLSAAGVRAVCCRRAATARWKARHFTSCGGGR